jgi:uncharacterized protein (TIGR02271 family)
MKQTVIGIFDDASEAARAVEQLQAAGFGLDSIDQSSRSEKEETNMTSSGSQTSGVSSRSDYYDTGKTGGISGFFKSLFGSDDDGDDTAKRYSEVAGRSHTIITVHAGNEEQGRRAAQILDNCGAIDVDDRASQYTGNAPQSMEGNPSSMNAGSVPSMDTATGTIPLMEEQLQVGKRVVETGGARLRSRIVSRPVEEQLRLREERVRVERRNVDRPATEADFQAFKEGEIEVIEHAEVPVVSKEARVVGEVSLNKDVEEHDETISDTVRHTEVDVDDIAGSEKGGTNNDKGRTNEGKNRATADSNF